MKKLFTDNRILLKILSGLIAIILWFAITYTEDPVISQVLMGIPVTFEGEEQLEENGLIVVNKGAIPDISVTVRGNRSNVISSIGSISAIVDVSGINQAGSSMMPVRYSYPSGVVALTKSKMNEITVETEKLVTRNIPVRIEMENADKNTEFMVKSECENKNVKVRGAESAVYGISYAMAEVDVSNITATGTQEYMYSFYDEKNNRLPGDNILYRSHKTLTVENIVYRKLTVPVEVTADDATRETYSMTVKNQSVTSVEIGVESGVTVDSVHAVISREEGKTEYETEIILPEGVYMPDKNRKVTVVCQFEPKVLSEVTVPVTVSNVPEGRTAYVEPKEITVSVKCGETTDPSGQITATADASDDPGGEGTVTVAISAPKEIEVVGAYSVTVRIQ